MVVTKIISVLLLQSVIPLSALALLVLGPQPQIEPSADHRTEHNDGQTDRIARDVPRRLPVEEHIRRDEAAEPADRNLYGRRDRPLVVPGHGIGQPAEDDGHGGEPAAHDEEESKVLRADGQPLLVEQHDIAHDRDAQADHGERVAVAHAVGHPGRAERHGCRDDVYWDRADLGLGGLEAHLVENRRDEELSHQKSQRPQSRWSGVVFNVVVTYRSGVTIAGNAHESESTSVYLPVRDDAYSRALVETIHYSTASVGGQASQEHRAFLVGQEFGCLWPVWNPPLAHDAADYSEEALENKDPVCAREVSDFVPVIIVFSK